MRDQLLKTHGRAEQKGAASHLNLIKKTKCIPAAERENAMSDLRTAVLLEGMKPRIPHDFAEESLTRGKTSVV